MILSLVAALAATAAPAAAPAIAPATAAPQLQRYAALALDPAGRRVATVDSRQVKGAPSAGHGTVVIRDATGAVTARFDPCPACSYAGLTWSPDGQALAFMASGEGQATLYVLKGKTLAPVTRVKGLADTPRWSADGRQIAFLATEDAGKQTGATQPGVRQVGVIGAKDDSRRIAVVAAAGGAYRLVSPTGTFVYEYDWLPDGSGLVGTAAEGNGDNNWWVASLRAFPLAGAMRVIAAPKTQITAPRVSPDGRTVAYVGGLMSDFGAQGGDVYSVPVTGGTPRDLTAGATVSFTTLQWRGPMLVASIISGGSMGVAAVDGGSGATRVAFVHPESIQAGDTAVALDKAGTTAAYVAQDFATPPHLVLGALGQGRTVTHDNDGLAVVARAQDLHWRRGGSDVQGWLVGPAGAAASSGAKAPMITVVHGGPASAHTPRFIWGNIDAAMLDHGYWLFMPNPRGSFGQGAAFTRANVRDFGGGDLQDILAGIDQAEKVAPIDDRRLGLYGHSYGGLMTMWTVTHSGRFKGAVAGAGISDWVAYYGQNGINQWMIPYFGASAYDDPAIYDKLSPIRSIKQAKTPTFIYVGERDVECPAAQSLEFWNGLKSQNVPTELVIYQDEGHGIRQPAHIQDLNDRMVGWFDRWLRP